MNRNRTTMIIAAAAMLAAVSGLQAQSGITVTKAVRDQTFYPEAYGARPGDGADDRAGIQAAIDACSTAGGGIVQLSKGTYNVQPTAGGLAIMLRTGVWLKGQGQATIISTDNTNAGVVLAYNLISPYGYNTGSVPYGADSMRISDLRVTGTSYSTTNPMGLLHNLIAVCHSVGGTLIENVGFGNAGAHAIEINQSSNVTVRNCYTIPGTGTGTSKLQLDTGGGQAGQKASLRYNTTISGAATYASNTNVLLTVASTANVRIGDHVVITGANGAQAAAYNAVGGFRVTAVPSATTMAIDLGWSSGLYGHVSSTATTAGTVTVSPVLENIMIDGWIDSPSANTTATPAREFADLSHNDHSGTARNVTFQNCVFRPLTLTIAPPSSYAVLGFDSGSYPMEISGFNFLNNTFQGGGHTGITILLQMNCGYHANYPRRKFRGIRIVGNRTINTGFYTAMHVGNAPNSDGTVQTTLTLLGSIPTHCLYWEDVTLESNVIESVLRSSVTSAARHTRVLNLGGIQDLVICNNHLIHANKSPQDTNLAAWASGGYYGMMIDHAINLTVDSNLIQNFLTTTFSGSFGVGIIFGCSSFEKAASLVPAMHRFTNNRVYAYSATGVATDLMAAGYGEVLTAGTTGKGSWNSQTNPQVKGLWVGNSFISTPGGSAHTCAMSSTLGALQISFNGSVATTARAPSWTEAPSGSNPGRHTWGYGIRSGSATLVAGTVTVADVMVTANSCITVTRTTAGGTTGDYTITRTAGTSFTITSSNAADTSVVAYQITEP